MSDLIKFSTDCMKMTFILEVSWIVVGLIILLLILVWYLRKGKIKPYGVELVSVEVEFGTRGIASKAKYDIKKYDENIYIANRIFIELVTRKAALEINPDEDVIEEVYNSWYELFKIIRNEIKAIPAKYLKDDAYTTNNLVELTMKILNDGLRPHLTKYQAEFRKWYSTAKEDKAKTPQEIQKMYPKFDELIQDIMGVNRILYEYSEQLKKIVHSK